jgi:formylglycine-generating enzyme required for sulfatase activity
LTATSGRPPDARKLKIAAGLLALAGLVGIILYIAADKGTVKITGSEMPNPANTPPSAPPPGKASAAVRAKVGSTTATSKGSAGPMPGGGDLSPSPIPSAPEYVTRVGQIKLRLIAAGKFMMGSPDGEGQGNEHPRHEVRITRPFYLGVTEVTQGQYEEIMGTNPSWFSASGRGGQGCGGVA